MTNNVQRWIHSSSNALMHVDDDIDDTPSWRDHVHQNWEIAIQIAHSILLSTSTSARLAFLRDDLTWLTHQGRSFDLCTRLAHILQISPSVRSLTSSNSSQRRIHATSIHHLAMPWRKSVCVSSKKTNPSAMHRNWASSTTSSDGLQTK